MSIPTLPETIDNRVKRLIGAGYNDATIAGVSNDLSSCSVRHHGSSQLLVNVIFTDQIANTHRVANQRCKLGVYGTRIAIVSTFPSAPKTGTHFAPGNIVPDVVGSISCISSRDGWFLTWSLVAGAAYYEIYSDNAIDGSSPVLVAHTDGRSFTVPYAATTDTYFAVRAISYAGYAGDLSDFVTDDTALNTPGGLSVQMTADLAVLYVNFATDTAHTAADFKEFLAYMANDAVGTGETLIGHFSANTWPYSLAGGTASYFALSAVDWAGNESDKTAWTKDVTAPPTPSGFSVSNGVGQVILNVNFATDTAHSTIGFRAFIAYSATDSMGTGATEIGRFSSSTWTYPMEMGTQVFFAISALDWGGNESNKTAWSLAQSLRENAMEEHFSTYGSWQAEQPASDSLYWLGIADMESDETWSAVGGATVTKSSSGLEHIDGIASTNIVCNNLAEGGAEYTFPSAIDFVADGRLTADDYVVLYVQVVDASTPVTINHYFMTDNSNYYKVSVILFGGLTPPDSWWVNKIKRSSFSATGAPDWANITKVKTTFTRSGGNVTGEFNIDNYRVAKADPEDADNFNETGGAWDFCGDQWHIFGPNENLENSLQTTPYSLGMWIQNEQALAVFQRKEFAVGMEEDFHFSGKFLLRATFGPTDGYLGLIWCVTGDYAGGTGTYYMAVLNNDDDQIQLSKVVDGVESSLATLDFDVDKGVWYWLGISHSKDGEIRVYVSEHPQIFDSQALKIVTSDTNLTQGKVGVVTHGPSAGSLPLMIRITDLVAGSPELAVTSLTAFNVAEGAGYGLEKYIAYSDTLAGADLDTTLAALVPSGLVAMWDNSDTPPTGWSVIAGAANRVLYAVSSGAGGTGGTATHSHTLVALDTQSNKGITSAYIGASAAIYDTLLDFNTAGTYTISRRCDYTDSQAHLYSAYKVLLIEKN